jgi:hypothetical protein
MERAAPAAVGLLVGAASLEQEIEGSSYHDTIPHLEEKGWELEFAALKCNRCCRSHRAACEKCER